MSQNRSFVTLTLNPEKSKLKETVLNQLRNNFKFCGKPSITYITYNL